MAAGTFRALQASIHGDLAKTERKSVSPPARAVNAFRSMNGTMSLQSTDRYALTETTFEGSHSDPVSQTIGLLVRRADR